MCQISYAFHVDVSAISKKPCECSSPVASRKKLSSVRLVFDNVLSLTECILHVPAKSKTPQTTYARTNVLTHTHHTHTTHTHTTRTHARTHTSKTKVSYAELLSHGGRGLHGPVFELESAGLDLSPRHLPVDPVAFRGALLPRVELGPLPPRLLGGRQAELHLVGLVPALVVDGDGLLELGLLLDLDGLFGRDRLDGFTHDLLNLVVRRGGN